MTMTVYRSVRRLVGQRKLPGEREMSSPDLMKGQTMHFDKYRSLMSIIMLMMIIIANVDADHHC